MNTNKHISRLLVIAMLAGLLASCGNGGNDAETKPLTDSETVTESETAPETTELEARFRGLRIPHSHLHPDHL